MIGFFKKQAELPEYLAHYGMHRPPFSTAPEADMYYSEPTRKQRLDILLHLAQYTNELLVVTGEKGMGKTMFLQQIINQASEHWKICHIEGHPMMTQEQFLQRVYRGFDIAHASNNKTSMLLNLKKRLDSMLKQALPILLVIDDAHVFSPAIISLILEIAAIKNSTSNTSVRVFLFSEPQIKITLAEPELDGKHRLIIRKIDLPPLNETHTGYYLHHRLSQAGMEAEQFLTKPTVAKIYKQSLGIPQKINEAADKLLFETTPIIRRTSNIATQNKRSSGGKYVLATMAVGIVVAIYAFHRYFDNDRPQPTTTVAGTTGGETVKPLKLPLLPGKKKTVTVPAIAPADNTGSAKFAEPSDPMQALKDDLAASEQGINNPQSNSAVSAQGTAREPELSLPQAKRPRDAKWILGQDATTYTLQLVSGHQQSTIENFIKKYQLDPHKLSYFYSQRNGQGWHNLTYGVFPDRQTASNAVKQLPAAVAREKPWIRQMRTIQSEIAQSR